MKKGMESSQRLIKMGLADRPADGETHLVTLPLLFAKRSTTRKLNQKGNLGISAQNMRTVTRRYRNALCRRQQVFTGLGDTPRSESKTHSLRGEEVEGPGLDPIEWCDGLQNNYALSRI